MIVSHNRRSNTLTIDASGSRCDALASVLRGAEWKPGTKKITCDFCSANVKILRGRKAIFDKKTRQAISRKIAFAQKQRQPLAIPGLGGELRKFQRQGVRFLEKCLPHGGAILADEMGLGKTIQTLAFLQLRQNLRPAIIVCPSAVKLNWQREANAWLSKQECRVLGGRTPTETQKHGIYIINYNILTYWTAPLRALHPQVLIFDECQYIKSHNTKRTKAARLLARKVPFVIGLSGTPIVNRPSEFFQLLHIIRPDLFPSWWDYVHQFCDAKHDGYKLDCSGASNTDQLHAILRKDVMMRREKADVLPELPPKQRTLIPVDMDKKARKEYRHIATDFSAWLKEQGKDLKGAQALVKIETLRQTVLSGKSQSCVNWIRDFLESGQKLVVFTWHTTLLDELQHQFQDICCRVDGSTTSQEKQKAVDAFQSPQGKQLLLGNIKSAGTGITLTAASNVAFLEVPWTPGALVQAEDRCHRITQSNAVNIWFLLTENTVETDMFELLQSKMKVVGEVLDGKSQQLSIAKDLVLRLRGK